MINYMERNHLEDQEVEGVRILTRISVKLLGGYD
jgi:hypothetical protein